MKMIFTLAVMMLATTSLYAGDCVLGQKCEKADCEALGKAKSATYALGDGGICVDSSKGENKLSDCTNQNGAGTPNDGKLGGAAATDAKADAGKAQGK